MGFFEEKKQELRELLEQIQTERNALNLLKESITKQENSLIEKENALNHIMIERQKGFPWLATAYEELLKLNDQDISEFLATKKHPSQKGAEVVKQEAARRRAAEKELKTSKFIIEYYESIAPFLIELKEEVLDSPLENDSLFSWNYDAEEKDDEVIQYLTITEYKKLPVSERNQMALDRYWQRRHSKAHVGKMYERYIGYLYEEMGYDVEYSGIFKGYEDLGRDLICSRGKELVVIQCKNWSKFKTIYEKHIFQFFGTVFEYKDKNPDKIVRAKFITSTSLSDLARRFANELNIELGEHTVLDKKYPSIKCNVSNKDGTKIYHLPFDQMYDKVKVEPNKGECYCRTVQEAEERGFRRAYKYYKKD